jgi:hypothetical protein
MISVSNETGFKLSQISFEVNKILNENLEAIAYKNNDNIIVILV